MRSRWVLVLVMAGPVVLSGQDRGQKPVTPPAASGSEAPAPGAASSAQGEADASGPRHVGNGVSAPKIVRAKNPGYSLTARLKKVQGTCLVTLVVDVQGNPADVHVSRSIAEGLPDDSRTAALELDQRALDAVKQYKFRPGMFQGKPVAVEITVGVRFATS